MKKTVLMIGMLMLFAGTSFSQINNWENIRSLTNDQRVVVETVQGKMFKGRFRSVDDGSVSFTKSGKTITLTRSDVRRVYLGKRSNSSLGGILGGVGGFFAGGFIAVAIYNQGNRQGDGLEGIAGAVPGAIGGALLGRKIAGGTRVEKLVYAIN